MSDKTFQIVIATPEREVYRDRITSVTLPTTEGEITVLAHHIPIVTTLKPGELMIRKNGEENPYAISGGFVEVRPDKLLILADTAEHIAEIDEQRAQEAIAQAEKIKAEKTAESVDYAQVAAKLERDLNRMRVIRKYRTHRARTPGITHRDSRPE